MKKKYNSRGKISHQRYNSTVIIDNGIARSANQKTTKLITMTRETRKKGRTLGDMVYEFIR